MRGIDYEPPCESADRLAEQAIVEAGYQRGIAMLGVCKVWQAHFPFNLIGCIVY